MTRSGLWELFSSAQEEEAVAKCKHMAREGASSLMLRPRQSAFCAGRSWSLERQA